LSGAPNPKLTAAEQQYPLGSRVLDAEHYRDPQQYAREIERIFLQAWFPVCPAADVAEPGDFLVWDQLGQSVAIVRLKDGSLTAWHNVCQHRGARLMSGRGNCSTGRIKCPWHGFAYDLSGELRSAPLRESFDQELLRGLRLPPVRVQEWSGFVWMTLSDETADLREYLGVIAEEIEGYKLAGFETKYRATINLTANWKLVMDAFNETWHVPFTHTDTLTGIIMWRDAVLHIEPPHSWMTLPVRGFTDHTAAGEDHRKTHLCHYLAFPNTIFSCFPTHLQMWMVWPLSPTESIMEAWGVVGPPPEGLSEEKWARRNDRDWEQFMTVAGEDAEVINGFGTIVNSLGFRRNIFNTAESRLSAFHDEVNARVEAERPRR
jgi:phenylpropionate dioxygenase-like ring-hydroxylating dioxygenase large terminal subunit